MASRSPGTGKSFSLAWRPGTTRCSWASGSGVQPCGGNHREACYDPGQLGSVLDAWHSSALHRPQRAQRRLLRLGQALHSTNIEALVGPVAPQCPQMLAALEIPGLDGPVIAATGEPLAIRAHSERLDCPLMPLPKRQALPALHVPPAYAPIAAATEQHRSSRTPGQRVHDRARFPPGLQALPTGHLPDEDLPTASSAPTATGQPRAIEIPGHAHDPATMPLEALQPCAVGGLPQAHAAILAATGQLGAIGTPRHMTDPGGLRTAHPPASAGGHLPHLHPLLIAPTGQQLSIRTPRQAIEGGVDAVGVP